MRIVQVSEQDQKTLPAMIMNIKSDLISTNRKDVCEKEKILFQVGTNMLCLLYLNRNL